MLPSVIEAENFLYHPRIRHLGSSCPSLYLIFIPKITFYFLIKFLYTFSCHVPKHAKYPAHKVICKEIHALFEYPNVPSQSAIWQAEYV
jgi:hypothetical protein